MDMNKASKIKAIAIAVGIPLLVGGGAALLSKDGFADFERLYQPLFTPPGWVFPVAWTLLYILMGLASYRVYASDASAPRKRRALRVYGVQLFFNFLWPILFFGWGMLLAALIELALLWLLVLLCQVLFSHISAAAGKLMIPYLIWTGFAFYLNLGIVLLN